MFTDPQSITVNSVAQSMPRVSVGDLKAVYKKGDQTYTLTISHQLVGGDRVRSMVRIDQRKVVTNPLDNSNDYDTLGVYLVFDRPQYGWSETEVDYVVQALKGWLTTGNVTALYGLQS